MKIIRRKKLVISAFNAENFMKIGKGMTSGERFKNKWFYMKYTGKYLKSGNTFDQ
jgi:hypothetical protein